MLNKARGFTLLELLVVMVILVTCLGVVGPRLSGGLEMRQVRSIAQELVVNLRATRSLAKQRADDVALLFDVENRHYSRDGNNQLVEIPSFIDLSFTSASSERTGQQSSAIRFFHDGSSTGGEVVLGYHDRGFRVVVSWLNGRVVLEPLGEV